MKATVLTAARDALMAFWAERDARERKILMVGGTALLAILLYMILIGPALTGRAKLNKSLPTLRQQSAEMQMLARQATSLRSTESDSLAVEASDETIGNSLVRRGLKPRSVTQTGNQIRVQLPDSSFSAISAWLAEIQQESGLAVTEIQVDAQKTIDIVNANITLRSLRGPDTQE
ncbi:MAG: type secretion system protein [Paucimonas sp.]|nr:type secretion system protein [Paucimonas sp.]